ncbi:PQQ-binding-like beta-propeller repeat protein [Actinomadura sp. WMMB 499]|uniref:outer membrane protein assembly factor BamB family protein n=1 Tax=Actinomadura sp. WMMB 499 TaxID=1219491 RepID=UPI00159E5B3C|nr:PQQ-binding-like beta-propeller repeat protein [Actinomadura sp. WMMB 499]
MLGLIAGGLAVALCVVLIDRFVLHAEWWEVRHRVTGTPVSPLGDVGPPPGPLAVSWERTTRVHRGSVAGFDAVSYDVAKGQVVAVSGQGVQVVDARTGAKRWSYSRSDWSLLGWTSTGSQLVGYFERDGHRADRVLVGFDVLSGSLLWKREGPRPAAVSRTTLRFPAGAGIVLATDEKRDKLIGLSAETGEPLYQRTVRHGCRLFDGAAQPSGDRESLVALALDCARQSRPSRLLALDPRTGEVRWDEVLGAEEAPEVTMLDGVTLVSDGTALRAFDEEGAEFASWDGDAVCGDGMCPSVLVEGRLLVVYHPAGTKRGTTLMEAVDVPSGNVAWAREVPAYTALARAGSDVYALRPACRNCCCPPGSTSSRPRTAPPRPRPPPSRWTPTPPASAPGSPRRAACCTSRSPRPCRARRASRGWSRCAAAGRAPDPTSSAASRCPTGRTPASCSRRRTSRGCGWRSTSPNPTGRRSGRSNSPSRCRAPTSRSRSPARRARRNPVPVMNRARVTDPAGVTDRTRMIGRARPVDPARRPIPARGTARAAALARMTIPARMANRRRPIPARTARPARTANGARAIRGTARGRATNPVRPPVGAPGAKGTGRPRPGLRRPGGRARIRRVRRRRPGCRARRTGSGRPPFGGCR